MSRASALCPRAAASQCATWCLGRMEALSQHNQYCDSPVSIASFPTAFRRPDRVRSTPAIARIAALFAAACLVLSPGAARAEGAPPAGEKEPTRGKHAESDHHRYHFQRNVACPFCSVNEVHYPRGRYGLHWHEHWSEVGLREYLTIGVLGAAALGIDLLVDPASGPRWRRPILLDDPIRDGLTLDTPARRKNAQEISDVLMWYSVAHAVALDNLAIAWGVRRRPGVAWQMLTINAQAYALTSFLNVSVKRLSSRERPWVERCVEGTTEFDCSSEERYRSFYSGHAALSATSAGLICAHHNQLELYGSPVLDTSACVAAVLGTAATGALRVSSENHWTSDVLVGHAMGYFSGYLVPTLLYYREFRVSPEPADTHLETAARSITFLPMATNDTIQLIAFGLF